MSEIDFRKEKWFPVIREYKNWRGSNLETKQSVCVSQDFKTHKYTETTHVVYPNGSTNSFRLIAYWKPDYVEYYIYEVGLQEPRIYKKISHELSSKVE